MKSLLVCGILAPVLYILSDIILGLSWKSYSFNTQSISELSAIGAPTRLCWILVSFLFNPLLIGFGIGIVKATATKLRIAGFLLALWGALGFVWLFFPMHLRGAIGSPTDTMHLVMAGITVPLMICFIALGSRARGKGFRTYSIFTIILMLTFGAITASQASLVAAQQPTPWLGIIERVSVYSPMVWVAVLALLLLEQKIRKEVNYHEIKK